VSATRIVEHHQHGLQIRLHRTPSGGLAADPSRLSRFQRTADRVSFLMGTPTNIVIWIIAVGAWIALGPIVAQHNFMPGWFTSNSFNFPLNTVTTIAELYIGFLVGASSNRSERNLEMTLGRLEQLENGTSTLLAGGRTVLDEVEGLIREVHGIVAQTNEMQMQQMTLLLGIEHANAELNIIRQALVPGAPNPDVGVDPAAG
jgi:low affinity Fe/Cu permease